MHVAFLKDANEEGAQGKKPWQAESPEIEILPFSVLPFAFCGSC